MDYTVKHTLARAKEDTQAHKPQDVDGRLCKMYFIFFLNELNEDDKSRFLKALVQVRSNDVGSQSFKI